MSAEPTRRARAGRAAAAIAALTLLIWTLEYSTYLVATRRWDAVVKLATFVPLALGLLTRRIPRIYWSTLALYLALLGTAFVGSVTTLDLGGVVQLIKIAVQCLTLPLLLSLASRSEVMERAVLKAPIAAGVLFSIQGIALAALLVSGTIPVADFIVSERFGSGIPVPWHWLFGWNVDQFDYGFYHQRVQGWFSEPALLGAFLIYPTLTAWGYFRSTRRFRFFLAAILCAAGVVLTVSLAAFIGLIVASLVLLTVRPAGSPRAVAKGVVWRLVLAVVLALGVITYGLDQLYGLREEQGKGTTVGMLLGRGEDQTLIRKEARLEGTLAIVEQHPLGVGLGWTAGTSDTLTTNALLSWLQSGGIPAAIVIGLLYWRAFTTFAVPALRSTRPEHRFVAAAWLGVTVQNLSYGNWVTPYYLFVVGAMMVCGRRARLMGGQAGAIA